MIDRHGIEWHRVNVRTMDRQLMFVFCVASAGVRLQRLGWNSLEEVGGSIPERSMSGSLATDDQDEQEERERETNH